MYLVIVTREGTFRIPMLNKNKSGAYHPAVVVKVHRGKELPLHSYCGL